MVTPNTVLSRMVFIDVFYHIQLCIAHTTDVDGEVAREEAIRPVRSYSIEDITSSLDDVLRQNEVKGRRGGVESCCGDM